MTQTLTPEQQALVRDVLAHGGAASQEEAVTRALTLLRDRLQADDGEAGACPDEDIEAVRRRVRAGYDDIVAGRHFESTGRFEDDMARYAERKAHWR